MSISRVSEVKVTQETVLDVSAVSMGYSSRLVTSVCSSDARLRLRTWDVDESSAIAETIGHAATGGPVGMVSSCALSQDRLVTAVTGESGNLKVIAWDVAADGRISPAGDVASDLLTTSGNLLETQFGSVLTAPSTGSAGRVTEIALAPLTHDRCATVVRDSAGRVKVIVWDIGADGALKRQGSASGGPADLVAVTPLTESRLFSAMRDSAGKLKVIVWDVDGNGNVTQGAEASAGSVDRIAVGTYGPTAGITHVRGGNGRLKIILWIVSGDGIFRSADCTGHEIQEVAAFGNVSAVRDATGFGLDLWQVTAGGPGSGIINPIGGGRTGKASNIAVNPLPAVSNPPSGQEIARMTTAARDRDGFLRVAVWHLVGSSIH